MLEDDRRIEADIKVWNNSECGFLSRSDTFESINSLSSAASSVKSGTRAKRYFCEYEGCEKAFTRPSHLTEHQATVHQGIKLYKCEQCDRSFSKRSHLERHLYAHSNEKPFSCSHCNKGFTTQQQLRRHEITHTKSFTCPHPSCDATFYKHPQLRSHILAVHEEKLTCQHCSKSFQRPYRLRNHIAKHHNPEVENPYQCSFTRCSMSFKTWSQLQTHIKNDHPKLQCPICDKFCVGENGMVMHMRVHDNNLVARNWKCGICNNISFAKKCDLISHYSKNHAGEQLPELLDDHEILRDKILTDEEEDGRAIPSKKRKVDELASIKTEKDLESYFAEGKSGMDLLLYSVGRKLKCPFDKCYRTFKTEERYKKHIEKHKIHQLKLKILQEKL